MICIVESTIELIQNKNTYIYYIIIVNVKIIFNLVIISIKLKLITTYSVSYDTVNYHIILYYSKLIIVHPIILYIVNMYS